MYWIVLCIFRKSYDCLFVCFVVVFSQLKDDNEMSFIGLYSITYALIIEVQWKKNTAVTLFRKSGVNISLYISCRSLEFYINVYELILFDITVISCSRLSHFVLCYFISSHVLFRFNLSYLISSAVNIFPVQGYYWRWYNILLIRRRHNAQVYQSVNDYTSRILHFIFNFRESLADKV